jgi:hypothetical protein
MHNVETLFTQTFRDDLIGALRPDRLKGYLHKTKLGDRDTLEMDFSHKMTGVSKQATLRLKAFVLATSGPVTAVKHENIQGITSLHWDRELRIDHN